MVVLPDVEDLGMQSGYHLYLLFETVRVRHLPEGRGCLPCLPGSFHRLLVALLSCLELAGDRALSVSKALPGVLKSSERVVLLSMGRGQKR